MKIESKLRRSPFSFLYRILYRFIRNVYGIDLPYTVNLGRRVIIEHQSSSHKDEVKKNPGFEAEGRGAAAVLGFPQVEQVAWQGAGDKVPH